MLFADRYDAGRHLAVAIQNQPGPMDSRQGGRLQQVQLLTGKNGESWSVGQIARMAQVVENPGEVSLNRQAFLATQSQHHCIGAQGLQRSLSSMR